MEQNNMEIIGQNKIKGLCVNQNGQDFIIGKASISEILQYTKYTERVIIGYDEEEKPIYNEHVQRKVEMSRANKIADFLINDRNAIFPTNIVLGVPMSIIENQHNHDGLVEITLQEKVLEQISYAKRGDAYADIYITIIDGQHRMKGIEIAIERLQNDIRGNHDPEKIQKLKDLLSMEMVVSYFVDKSLEYQAMIFSTINRTQKRVSQDLVYSLFGLSSNDTPYKTALEVVLALNGHPKSPFYKRIKLYGGDYEKNQSPPLSQATMIKNIVALISETLRDSENDKYRSRKDLRKQKGTKFLPFRLDYANNKDYRISDCLFYFFNAIRSILGSYWNYDNQSKPQNILQATVGFEALLHLLVEILKKEFIKEYDNQVFVPFVEKIRDIPFGDTELFPMSTRGKQMLILEMSLKVFPPENSDDERLKKRIELNYNTQ